MTISNLRIPDARFRLAARTILPRGVRPDVPKLSDILMSKIERGILLEQQLKGLVHNFIIRIVPLGEAEQNIDIN